VRRFDAAIDRLRCSTSSDTRFVFFVDPDSRRGNVVFRRYDGNYGLIIRT
jgi:hypothetical protein